MASGRYKDRGDVSVEVDGKTFTGEWQNDRGMLTVRSFALGEKTTQLGSPPKARWRRCCSWNSYARRRKRKESEEQCSMRMERDKGEQVSLRVSAQDEPPRTSALRGTLKFQCARAAP
jgi:hypothetical protein